MPALPSNFYTQWRAQEEARLQLREHGSAHPPERVLQNVWRHQRLNRDQLRTTDGQALRVLHPGFWNLEAGPDFRGAVLQFGHDAPCAGDVEIDLLPRHWKGHHHQDNPAYAGVILRVVWEAQPAEAASAPLLELRQFLDQPVSQLELWSGGADAAAWPENLRGACSAPLAALPEPQIDALLEQAALVRLQRKARDLELRARQAGWEQALWEGLFRALGYKNNVWPMQRVAELLPQLRGHAPDALAWQALFLGVSGFLPAELSGLPGSASYARRLWDHWWREREHFSDVLLPKKIWRLQGRPANHPQRRLALAAHWLARGDLIQRLEQWFAADHPPAALCPGLLEILQAPEDEYWSWHWTFTSARLSKPQPLLGQSRVTDLAINVILPWFLARAGLGPQQRLAEQRYLTWPEAQGNALLSLARDRLLGARAGVRFKTAARQQGLLQIIRDFCDHSNAICTDCTFPAMIKGIAKWEEQ